MKRGKKVGDYMIPINDLFLKLGITRYPERWQGFYGDVMNDYEENGCVYTTVGYYEELNSRYACFDKYIDIYCSAAQETAKDKHLSIFLALLCRGMKDRAEFISDLKALDMPVSGDGEYSLAYEMITGLAMASATEQICSNLERRGVPKSYIREIAGNQQNGIREYMRRNAGRAGYANFGWFQHLVDGNLFRIGSLEYQINCGFPVKSRIYNDSGRIVALADGITLHRNGMELGCKCCEDTDGSWTAVISDTSKYADGYSFAQDGTVSKERVRLCTDTYTKILEHGDNVISIHIPSETDFTPQSVDKSLDEARRFFKKYFPEYEYRAFMCASWLMSPALCDILKPGSNIVSFNKRFMKFTNLSQGEGAISFVFLQNPKTADISALPENTSLERAIKNYYMSGKVIYEMTGCFFDNI